MSVVRRLYSAVPDSKFALTETVNFQKNRSTHEDEIDFNFFQIHN